MSMKLWISFLRTFFQRTKNIADRSLIFLGLLDEAVIITNSSPSQRPWEAVLSIEISRPTCQMCFPFQDFNIQDFSQLPSPLPSKLVFTPAETFTLNTVFPKRIPIPYALNIYLANITVSASCMIQIFPLSSCLIFLLLLFPPFLVLRTLYTQAHAIPLSYTPSFPHFPLDDTVEND